MKPLRLSPLVEDAIETNAEFARQCGVEVRLIRRNMDKWVMGDDDRLIQVLTNLLSNAIKFSPQGGTVECRIRSIKGRVRVSVSDQGPGVPDSFRAHAFERFSQADGSDRRQKGGSGLGLNICKLIITAHGGTIDFETTLGKGSTFFFELPETAAVSAGGRHRSAA